MVNISVIIPVYNAEPYLRDCLNSIISQELENLEVICINDGSWDKSQEILAEYSWKYPYIKIVEQTNRGAFAARNLGMQLAKGEYVCFIDADDYYPDSFVLSDMFYAAKENNALICGGSFQEDRPSEKIDEWSGNLSRYKFNTDGFIEYKNYQFEYGYHRFIYKKDFIKKQGEEFRGYIWGKRGISELLKKMNRSNYGNDLQFVLFQFYVKPLPEELSYLKEIEAYRKKERSIGIPIIINDENFFSKTERGRYDFLGEVILAKMTLLAEVVKRRKLDTNMVLLISDLKMIIQEFGSED